MTLKETIETLENRGNIQNGVIVEVAINTALDFLKRMKRNEEDTYDFQGWKEKKLTYKDLKEFLAAHDGELNDEAKLKVYVDDGMGYGAQNGICTDLFISTSEKSNDQELQVWI